MTYGNLEGVCKEEVITLLKISQNNLCAYCQGEHRKCNDRRTLYGTIRYR